MYAPLNYEQINLLAGTYSPSQVKSYNNKSFWFWVRSLFQRATTPLDITLPDEWQGNIRDFFNYCLYRLGYVVILDDPDFGQTFQPCSLYGQNWYYGPTDFLIANPQKEIKGKLGKDGELLKLTPDYMGIWDIIEYYAEKLSTLDVSINTGLINSQIGLILGAKNKAASEALKKTLDLIHEGEPAVIIDRLIEDEEDTEPWQSYSQDLRQIYMVPEQLQDFQTLLNNFDTEIGIPTLPYAKKERMVTSEADSRIIDASARSLTWFETLKSSIKEIKKLYPDIKLDVKLRYDKYIEKKGDETDEQSQDDPDRDADVHETNEH